MRFASAFTGIGGFESAWRELGIETGTMIEIDRNARKVLTERFPNATLLEDINDVSGSQIGRVDGLVGGFPCQDTSIGAPNRLGLAGKRSGNYFEFVRLLHEYQRLVDELQCRWVVIENPVGLLSSPGVDRSTGEDRTGWDMAATIRGLEDLGYGVAYRVVDGQHLGTPQHRERVIVVGHLGGDARPAWQVLGDGNAGPGPAPESAKRRSPGGPQAFDGTVRLSDGTDALIFRKSARARASLAAGGYETWVPSEHSNTLTRFDAGDAGRQTHLIVQDGRVRTLTVTEWERLQGFPDDWTNVGLSDGIRMNLLGNAMHTGMARWVGQRIQAVDAALPMITNTKEMVA